LNIKSEKGYVWDSAIYNYNGDELLHDRYKRNHMVNENSFIMCDRIPIKYGSSTLLRGDILELRELSLDECLPEKFLEDRFMALQECF
jgi:hypothetical protein